jgi:hypothetical protein
VGEGKYITSQVMMEMYEFLWATTSPPPQEAESGLPIIVIWIVLA